MYELKHDVDVCNRCETIDCMMRCQHISLDLETAREERKKILKGEDSRIYEECLTCYACEEYCPSGNHPFYLIVDRQDEKGYWPVPRPITNQQLIVMGPRGRIRPQKLEPPLINMCAFSMLNSCVRGRLFEGASTFSGNDVFCNIMWLHFGKTSTIKERLPPVIENIENCILKESGINEFVCFHDECYGTYTHLAPAMGIDVPFKPIHLFDFISQRLDKLKTHIKPLNVKVAYQRPCSNRLVPETQGFVDEIFEKIGADRVKREYDYDNALCCAGTVMAQQKLDKCDDLQKRNIDDMVDVGAKFCVFNCPACLNSIKDRVAERGIMPILMSELCQLALGD